MSDLEDSLVTSSRLPVWPQKRPDDRTSNGSIAAQAADGSQRTAGAADERCWRCRPILKITAKHSQYQTFYRLTNGIVYPQIIKITIRPIKSSWVYGIFLPSSWFSQHRLQTIICLKSTSRTTVNNHILQLIFTHSAYLVHWYAVDTGQFLALGP